MTELALIDFAGEPLEGAAQLASALEKMVRLDALETRSTPDARAYHNAAETVSRYGNADVLLAFYRTMLSREHSAAMQRDQYQSVLAASLEELGYIQGIAKHGSLPSIDGLSRREATILSHLAKSARERITSNGVHDNYSLELDLE